MWVNQTRDIGLPSYRDAGRYLRDFAAAMAAPALESTRWRQNRLLVLGYHGVSLDDEHLWDGVIYMSPPMFRRRMSILREAKYTVLPLGVALQRLCDGTLPPRAIALVFDDGFHDFAQVTAPILSEFGYPATVYLSTYYSKFNRPIFDIMLRYLLWKGSQRTIALPGILAAPVVLNDAGQRDVSEKARAAAFASGMTGREKDKLLGRIAVALDIDYELLCRRRLLHTMNAEEARAMKAQGYDIQLHTHRHRVSRDQDLFAREIHQNRHWIQEAVGGTTPVHLSFPGGVWEPVEREWLTELGIETAMTCIPALADRRCDKLRIPRFVDNAFVSEHAFRAWVAGSMTFFPKGKNIVTAGQVLEETIDVSASGARVRAARV
jgi:peptidoglycan/xylan/chitin deacetylase (PgdA/CDA1 family)